MRRTAALHASGEASSSRPTLALCSFGSEMRAGQQLPPLNVEALARAYGGSRVIADVEGTHSSPRNRRALDYCGQGSSWPTANSPDDDAIAGFQYGADTWRDQIEQWHIPGSHALDE